MSSKNPARGNADGDQERGYAGNKKACRAGSHGNLMASASKSCSRTSNFDWNNSGLVDCVSSVGGTKGCHGTSNISELRSVFTSMDCEIQRLRTDLKQRDSDEKTYMNLRQELNIIMQNAEKGLTQKTELECINQNLEQQKKVLECKLDDAVRALEDRVTQSQMLDTRLSERTRQVQCLQEDNQDKASKIKSLECAVRDLRQKLASCETIPQGRDELDAALKKIRELEDALQIKENSYEQLRAKYVTETKDFKAEIKKLTARIACMGEQVNEFQRQLDQMSCDAGQVRQDLAHCTKDREEEKRKNCAKEQQIKQLQSLLDEEQTTMHEKDLLCEKMIANMNKKLEASENKAKDLSSALAMCKSQVNKHLATMDEVRRHFDGQIQQKDSIIKSLTEQLRKCKEDKDCKDHELKNLEHTLHACKTKVDELYKSLAEAENCKICLSEKLKQCEKKALSEKALCMKEMEDLERKLTHAMTNLQVCSTEMAKLKQQLGEKSAQLDCCTLEKNSLARDLAGVKQQLADVSARLAKMDKDNTELCNQLQLKMESIKELETAICSKDHDLKNCMRCLEDLNKKFNQMNSGKAEDQSAMKNLMDKLKNCTEELMRKTRLLVECEEMVKKCKIDLECRQDEVNQLKLQLNDTNCKLQARIVKVEELEKAIEAIHKDTEKRMKRVDEQLRRYECELSEKVRQLADMEECLTTSQHKLAEKVQEYCEAEQRSNRLCCDLQALSAKYKALDEGRQCCERQLNESKGEICELTQQLRSTRDEFQAQHCELVETRNSLVNCNREVEKLRRQIDDCKRCLDTKDCELKTCSADRNALLTKVANLQCRMEQEQSMHSHQMAEYKTHVEKEMTSCRVHCSEVEEKNCLITQKLSATTRHLQQVEKGFSTKMDGLSRELQDFVNRLADREDQILNLKDCINKKEAEMMKLKMRLCTCENNTSCNNSHSLQLVNEQYDHLLLKDNRASK